ncbi:sulfatase-like hydrolase/transferase [Desulfonatronum thiodismutans]|uniref:sulfatase-like hydrolase/transferase n=1 Tax=Desulfonatronum thiodismutans TaxID=159290 RepID=UPI000691FFC7|nr:sulfatase-like hydrolase/transferase [Desulfonatronum thiodismutans]
MTSTQQILLSLVCYAISTWLLSGSLRVRPVRYGFGLSGFCLILATGVFLIADSFTTMGIDASVTYHLRYGLSGAGFAEYSGSVYAGMAMLSLAAAVGFVSVRRLRPIPGRSVHSRSWTAPFVLGAAFLVNPGIQDISRLATQPLKQASGKDHFTVLYHVPPITPVTGRPKNLVFIYAESLERTYFDESLFPGLIQGLRELEQEALSFTGVEQVSGTHWTIAGMVASQCGIPLVTSSGGNSMSGIDHFLPGAICLGDVLQAQGYALTFLGGADLDFAGKGKFYATHGFSEIKGKTELQGILEDPAYLNEWGLYDDVLLEYAGQRFEQLSQTPNPFAMVLLTLDTHHPRGHPSRKCAGMRYQTGDNPVLNAVKCSDYLISKFVRDVMRSSHWENTLIVIASDHLAMGNTATHLLDQGNQKNMFMVIDSDHENGIMIDKPGTTLDIAPTVLSLLGFDVSLFGLGRALIGAEPTLIMQESDLGLTLAGFRSEIAMFWRYPVVREGIRINVPRRSLHVNERVFQLPTLLHLSKSGEILDVFFEYQLFDYAEKLASYFSRMKHDDVVVWVDFCQNFRGLDLDFGEDSFCVYLGKVDDEKPLVTPIIDEIYISMKLLDPFLK